MLDRTLYNIVTLIVGGAALISALTGIAVQHQMFLGGNPYAEKNDVIQRISSRVAVGITFLAIGAQVIEEILSDSVLPARLHSTDGMS